MFSGPVTMDSVTRALVMHMTMNGAHGCAWWRAKELSSQKAGDVRECTPLTKKQPKERTAPSFSKDARKADAQGTPCEAITGMNVLVILTLFFLLIL